MPNIYHSDEVFSAYVAEHGSMGEAKAAIKEVVEENAPTPENA